MRIAVNVFLCFFFGGTKNVAQKHPEGLGYRCKNVI